MRTYLTLLLCLLVTSTQVLAQSQTLTGRVVSEAGEPIEGATINAKGTKQNTISNSRGEFSLSVPQGVKSLIVSAVGFDREEVSISGSVVSVALRKNTQQLSEVVILGYGQAQKREVTGSVAKVNGRDLENQPVQSFESAMQGRAPGVVIENTSGKLGQGIKVRIRGTSSISANSQPLYVIDGIPLTTASQSNLNNEPTNPLIDLNPGDIESIEILKDAAAAAIYGARGANGVVLITTKKGSRTGRSAIEFNSNFGYSNPTRKRGFLNTREYVQALRDAARNDGRAEFNDGNPNGYANEQAAIDAYIDYVETEIFDYFSLGTDWANAEVDVNWEDEQFRKNALSSQYDISVRGGNDRTRFYASGFYSDQEAIVIVNRFKRYGGRLNLDHSINDRASIGMNVTVSRSQLDRVTNDAAFSTPGQLVAQLPLSPLIDPETNDLNANTLYSNGMFDAKYNNDNQVTVRTVGNVFGQYQLFPNLLFRSEFGADIINLTQKSFADPRTQDGSGIGDGRFVSSQNLSYNTNNYFAYSPNVGSIGKLTATLGMSYLQNDLISSQVNGENYPSGAVKNLNGATDITSGNTSEARYNFLSYFLRANLTIKDKFLFGASVRSDGSSRFGPAKRFGYFPAGSVGWIISEENFLRASRTINFLKLRASYGLAGNAEIGEHQFLQLYTVSNYPSLPGFVPRQLGDPNLRWEKTTQYDVGLEFGLFNNRLSGEVDIYNKKSRDLLLAVNFPSTNGFFDNVNLTNQILQNLGTLENRGVEIQLTGKIIDQPKLSWTTSFNIAFNKNKITDINGQVIIGSTSTRAIEGEPIGVFYVPKFVGVDPANGDALFEGADGRPTATYSAAPRKVVGNPNPDYTGGFTNNFRFGNFDASVFFVFVQGNEIYNDGGRFMTSGFANGFDNQTKDILRAWKNPGDVTNVPRSGFTYVTGHRISSRWVYDGSYVRLRQLNLGYTLKNIGPVSSVRFFVQGTNLWTKTEYAGDPEVSAVGTNRTSVPNIAGGTDFYVIPQPRTISFGLNVKI